MSQGRCLSNRQSLHCTLSCPRQSCLQHIPHPHPKQCRRCKGHGHSRHWGTPWHCACQAQQKSRKKNLPAKIWLCFLNIYHSMVRKCLQGHFGWSHPCHHRWVPCSGAQGHMMWKGTAERGKYLHISRLPHKSDIIIPWAGTPLSYSGAAWWRWSSIGTRIPHQQCSQRCSLCSSSSLLWNRQRWSQPRRHWRLSSSCSQSSPCCLQN